MRVAQERCAAEVIAALHAEQDAAHEAAQAAALERHMPGPRPPKRHLPPAPLQGAQLRLLARPRALAAHLARLEAALEDERAAARLRQDWATLAEWLRGGGDAGSVGSLSVAAAEPRGGADGVDDVVGPAMRELAGALQEREELFAGLSRAWVAANDALPAHMTAAAVPAMHAEGNRASAAVDALLPLRNAAQEGEGAPVARELPVLVAASGAADEAGGVAEALQQANDALRRLRGAARHEVAAALDAVRELGVCDVHGAARRDASDVHDLHGAPR